MRCTLGSVAALAAAIVIAMASWPEQQAGLVMERAVAQAAEKQKDEKAVVLPRDHAARATEKKLNEIFAADFVETPLQDVLSFMRDQFDVQFFVDSTALDDAGIDLAKLPITSNLSVRGAKWLELALDAHGLGYMIDNDGLVFISSKEELDSRLTLRIYDCRKILATAAAATPATFQPTFRGEEKATEGGEGSGVDAPAQRGNQTSNRRDGVFHLVQFGVDKPGKPMSPAEKLIDVITGTVAEGTWSDNGGPGTIREFNGLLVVNQTQAVQERIADLLDQLSETLAIPAK